MVRRCVVPLCTSTDQTTLVHRFPRKHCRSWQECLKLNSYRISDLLNKYVVCAHHFRISDYRNTESKHLNTTALPTLNIIPENDKNPEVRTGGLKAHKRHIDNEPDVIMKKSNSVMEKTKIYSNCFTLSSSSPMTLNANEPPESDDSNENALNSDYEVMEEENYLDEETVIEPRELDASNSSTTHLLNCDDITECLQRGTVAYIDRSICDKDTNSCDNLDTDTLDDHLTQYVIETNEDIDEDCQLHEHFQKVVSPSSSLGDLYKDLNKNDLIDQLVAATSRIKELETKLANIQEAHLNMIQNLNNFNKVLIS